MFRLAARSARCGRIIPQFSPLRLAAFRSVAQVPDTPLEHQHVTIPRPPVNVDRELPDPFKTKKTNRKLFIIYGIGVTVACAFVFNYEKTSSPVINSVLYILRRSEAVKHELGSNITFRDAYPWISGPLNTVQGNVDVSFRIKGDDLWGIVRLAATRSSKLVPFDVSRFELDLHGDGTKVIDLRSEFDDFDL